MNHLETHILNIRPSILSDREALPTLHMYGSDTVEERITGSCNLNNLRAEFHRVDPFTTFTAGEIKSSTLLANHGPGTILHHVVEHDGKVVMLGWETGWWSDETWEAVSDFKFDAVISSARSLDRRKSTRSSAT